jgi:hypothetical protein
MGGCAVEELKQGPEACGAGFLGARAGAAHRVVPLVLSREASGEVVNDHVVGEVLPGLGDSCSIALRRFALLGLGLSPRLEV